MVLAARPGYIVCMDDERGCERQRPCQQQNRWAWSNAQYLCIKFASSAYRDCAGSYLFNSKILMRLL